MGGLVFRIEMLLVVVGGDAAMAHRGAFGASLATAPR
jgi:hypothetical protein